MADRSVTAFVLSGGGKEASAEIGMLAALLEAEIRPDLILGASAGAALGAFFAAKPDADGLRAVREFWLEFVSSPRLAGLWTYSLARPYWPPLQQRSRDEVAAALQRHLPAAKFEDLQVRFQCPAIDLAHPTRTHWLTSGPLLPALLASMAGPWVLPPAQVDGRELIDGAFADPIPIQRAVKLGARTIYVLPATDLRRPRGPVEVLRWIAPVPTITGFSARFHHQLDAIGDKATVHCLPLGRPAPTAAPRLIGRIVGVDLSASLARADAHIIQAYHATAKFLATLASTSPE
ncbi:patatin-like phospholipase family protein [Nocardia sp. XZ_19_385]|uniref:patatin-like phospholipase family protein n=1 Tax=Nocardia sp. XZ_19_385 TaxID=2769488 RepID=UPI00188F2465|nr:patatin-like phospholipase family protein [Nocardia sp. XZ_19_385]